MSIKKNKDNQRQRPKDCAYFNQGTRSKVLYSLGGGEKAFMNFKGSQGEIFERMNLSLF